VTLSTRLWIETTLAAASSFLSVLTLVSREWIEAVFRVDPDQHSGALEWAIVAALVITTVVFGLLARSEWRRVEGCHDRA
jgi:glucan phosphoethanolaminetransferase (alkaline phosphatase superfamily)